MRSRLVLRGHHSRIITQGIRDQPNCQTNVSMMSTPISGQSEMKDEEVDGVKASGSGGNALRYLQLS